jgi:RimJ/RimL family protein N-acetyltransferase
VIGFRDVVEDDAEWMAALSQDPDVLRYADPERMHNPRTAAEIRSERFPEIRRAQQDGVWWAVLEDATPVGWVFLRRTVEGWELGYRLGKAAWGRGIATTAARAVMRWAVEQGIERVYADVAAPNAASVRILEKLGFTLVRVGEWHGMEDRRYERSLCG